MAFFKHMNHNALELKFQVGERFFRCFIDFRQQFVFVSRFANKTCTITQYFCLLRAIVCGYALVWFVFQSRLVMLKVELFRKRFGSGPVREQPCINLLLLERFLPWIFTLLPKWKGIQVGRKLSINNVRAFLLKSFSLMYAFGDSWLYTPHSCHSRRSLLITHSSSQYD